MGKQLLTEGFSGLLKGLFKAGTHNADDVLRLFREEGVRALKGSSKFTKYAGDIQAGVKGVAQYDKAIETEFRRLAKQGKPIVDTMGKLPPGAAKDYSKAIAFNEAYQHLNKPRIRAHLDDLLKRDPDAAFKYIDDVLDDAVNAQKKRILSMAVNAQKKRILSMADDAEAWAKAHPTTPKPAPGTKPVPGAKPVKPVKPVRTGWQKARDRAKLIGKFMLAGGIITGAWLLYNIFDNYHPTPEQVKEADLIAAKINKMLKFFPCIAAILDDEGVYLEISEAGNVKVMLTKTGNAEYDAVGGLAFYPNGIVQKINQPRATGTFTCNAQNLSEEFFGDYFENLVIRTLMEQQAQPEQQQQNDASKYGGDNNTATGIGGFNIIWQTDAQGKDETTATGNRTTPRNNCDNKKLPHEKGCYSAEIGEVQECIGGMRVTGILDDKTIAKLTAMGYDMSQGLTDDVYNRVLKNECGKVIADREARLDALRAKKATQN